MEPFGILRTLAPVVDQVLSLFTKGHPPKLAYRLARAARLPAAQQLKGIVVMSSEELSSDVKNWVWAMLSYAKTESERVWRANS
jgi:hypothetical protein